MLTLILLIYDILPGVPYWYLGKLLFNKKNKGIYYDWEAEEQKETNTPV